MGWVDLVLLGVLAVSVLLGLWRGLVFEVLSILGWVVAYFACPYVAPFIANWLPQDKLAPNLLHALSLVLAFMLILLLWGLSARLLRALIHATPLSIIDRVLGGGFGVLRGVLIGLLAVVLVSMTPAVRSGPWQESQVAPWLQAALHLLTPVLPAEVLKFIPV
ncbi:CvpA family protein [Paucibacter sp. O1-1]|uniref:CvpA family protein n=1 Tax=unclassified Roseateles TaxID=2626991 RepID=UPI0021D4FD6E|nr:MULTISPECIES: CvpA family protein [unclassified Roseateles]MCU7375534.1 CvpA family protein [Paucibacter sp. O1-1]MCZ7884733.1 CvpA family protein [Paucibacter sp. M5-1]MDA3830542.1 CvpA family protein [Paucibacter sp. O1-1]MDC6168359.1 CvpA family protein [Paucibacter sp. XJ19-41]